ncbi:MAG TPA: hypothetical protein VN915_14065 [Elusimicrobiota bacterium]|nr:hypothetical protein [Elusimicrobiota bacterium]
MGIGKYEVGMPTSKEDADGIASIYTLLSSQGDVIPEPYVDVYYTVINHRIDKMLGRYGHKAGQYGFSGLLKFKSEKYGPNNAAHADPLVYCWMLVSSFSNRYEGNPVTPKCSQAAFWRDGNREMMLYEQKIPRNEKTYWERGVIFIDKDLMAVRWSKEKDDEKRTSLSEQKDKAAFESKLRDE